MYNFLYETVLIFPNIYIIHKRNKHILAQKIRQEELIKLIKILELYEVFVCQNVMILPYCILLAHTKSIFNTSH